MQNCLGVPANISNFASDSSQSARAGGSKDIVEQRPKPFVGQASKGRFQYVIFWWLNFAT